MLKSIVDRLFWKRKHHARYNIWSVKSSISIFYYKEWYIYQYTTVDDETYYIYSTIGITLVTYNNNYYLNLNNEH